MGSYTAALFIAFASSSVFVCAQDTTLLPRHGSAGFITSCNGILMDDGGVGNYSDTTNGYVTIIAPAWNTVSLLFEQFELEQVFDYVRLYDGPGTASPLIGQYSGTQLQGQIVNSTGMYLTVQQVTDDVYNLPGFVASWQCLLGNENIADGEFAIFPNPAFETLNIHSPGNSFAVYTIVNIAGQIVMSGSGSSVDISNLQPGIYFLILQDLSKSISQPKSFVKY